MNNYYRFYKSVWTGRVPTLPTTDLYKAVTGMYYETDDTDLSTAIADLAHEELMKRGEISPRGSAMLDQFVSRPYEQVG
jgi:hypothetical protein